MSYYQYQNTYLPGDLAKAEDVESDLKRVQASFALLPTARTTGGKGFAEPFIVAPATSDSHAANFGQLKTYEALALGHKNDAETAATTAVTRADEAAIDAATADTKAAEALASANLSESWAVGTGEIETGKYSAKYYADLARVTVEGAKSYVGIWDASGGTLPIASPTVGDTGKFWVISVAGTLPVVGAATNGDELSINSSQQYELRDGLTGTVSEINGKTGPQVTLTPSDIGAAPASHTHTLSQITDAGTAASKDTGTDSGDVMLVGAFGVGATSLTLIGDLSSITLQSGRYKTDGTTTNKPDSNNYLVDYVRDGSYVAQSLTRITSASNPARYFRLYDSSSWSAWQRFATTAEVDSTIQSTNRYIVPAGGSTLAVGKEYFVQATVTLNLPSTTSLTAGERIRLVRSGPATPTVVVEGTNSETINDPNGNTDTSLLLDAPGEVTLIFNGTDWEV